MKQLTQQQKRFVSEYIRTLNGETAAEKAGYKCKDLKSFNLVNYIVFFKQFRGKTF